MKQKFEIVMHNDIVFDAPCEYEFDPNTYEPQIKSALAYMASSAASQVEFFWVGEDTEAQFFDDEEAVTILNDYECAWKGTHLRVFKDGQCQLYWESKHTEDEFWVGFKLETMVEPLSTESVQLKNYVVLYSVHHIDKAPDVFTCQAESTGHAVEQCTNVYPGMQVVWVSDTDNVSAALQEYLERRCSGPVPTGLQV